MKRLSIKFRHDGKVIALRALIKFDDRGHLRLTKHKCNSSVRVEVLGNYTYLLVFDRPGTYYYAVCGHFSIYFKSISYISPYNKITGLCEQEISDQCVIERKNW